MKRRRDTKPTPRDSVSLTLTGRGIAVTASFRTRDAKMLVRLFTHQAMGQQRT